MVTKNPPKDGAEIQDGVKNEKSLWNRHFSTDLAQISFLGKGIHAWSFKNLTLTGLFKRAPQIKMLTTKTF